MEPQKLAVMQDRTEDPPSSLRDSSERQNLVQNLDQIGLTFGVPEILSATESLLEDTIHELFFAVQPHSPL